MGIVVFTVKQSPLHFCIYDVNIGKLCTKTFSGIPRCCSARDEGINIRAVTMSDICYTNRFMITMQLGYILTIVEKKCSRFSFVLSLFANELEEKAERVCKHNWTKRFITLNYS